MVRRIVQAHIGIFGEWKKHQSKKISERTKKSLDAKRARGDKEWRVGGFTEKERAKSLLTRKENRRNDPDYQKSLAFILLLRKDGLTWREISHLCNESGFTTRTGKKIVEGSAHRMVKYHWTDYVHDRWHAKKKKAHVIFPKLADIPKKFLQNCADSYFITYDLDPMNKFKKRANS